MMLARHARHARVDFLWGGVRSFKFCVCVSCGWVVFVGCGVCWAVCSELWQVRIF
jgi:hypothetical protein